MKLRDTRRDEFPKPCEANKQPPLPKLQESQWGSESKLFQALCRAMPYNFGVIAYYIVGFGASGKPSSPILSQHVRHAP